MNSRTALITLALALLACGALYWVSRPNRGPNPSLQETPVWLAGFDPAQASSLRVRWSDGDATLSPTRLTDVWLLSADGATWPVASSRIRGALRLIAELNAANASPQDDAPLGDTAATVTITTPAGEGEIKIGASVVGGRGWVELASRDGKPLTLVVDAGFTRLFSKAGILAWREAAPLIAAPGEPMRLTVEAGEFKSQVSRVKGRWGMIVPIAAPAHGEFVQAAILRAHSMEVRRFLGATEAATLSFESPTATLITETQCAGESRSVLVQEAVIGHAADVEGGAAFVRASAQWLDPASGSLTPAWGPLVMIVERKSIELITADPRAYISKRALATPGADVLRIAVTPARGPSLDFSRALSGWQLNAQPTGAPVDALVRLLCETDASIPQFKQPDAFVPLAGIEPAGSGGAFAKVVVGEAANSKGAPLLFVMTDGVWREFAHDAKLAAWLKSLSN